MRDIHKELGEKLDIVYISIDDKRYIEAWRDMMRKGEMPGRSLITLDKKDEVRNKYFVPYIPYSFLVHPKGKLEAIDVREEKDRKNLYRLIDQSIN